MKILFINNYIHGGKSGAASAARMHLETLRRAFGPENIDVISLVGKNRIHENQSQNETILYGFHSRLLLFVNCLLGFPTYLNFHVVEKILSIIKRRKPDLIFVDDSIFGILIKKIKDKYPSIPVISFYNDIKAYLGKEWKDRAPLFKKPVYQAMIDNEKITASYSDINLVLNDREKNRFLSSYGEHPIRILHSYMSSSEPLKQSSQLSVPLEILFVGTYYYPNVNGIKWFIEQVCSGIPFPFHLTIAGSEMERAKNQIGSLYLNKYSISILENVPDLSTLYNASDVVICPIFEGGGMKTKVAEAMSYGKIIIASQESFFGYQENITQSLWNHYFFLGEKVEDYLNALSYIRNTKGLFKFNEPVYDVFLHSYSEQYAQKTLLDSINLAIQNIT
jgi:glycosyltransferase involved in cell wall biosynthesis